MDKLQELLLEVQKYRIEGLKFAGAQAYSDEKAAQLSSQYNVGGLSTAYYEGEELICVFLVGKRVMSSVLTE